MHDVVKNAKADMAKVVERAKDGFSGISAGRANPGLLSRVQVDYFGSRVPLQQLANVNVLDSRSLSVAVYDKNNVTAVEKAISQADLGANTSSEGQTIRVTLPSLTQERRHDFVKLAKQKAEEFRIEVRGVRQKVRQDVTEKTNSKKFSETDQHSIFKDLDSVTHEHIEQIDKAFLAKEAELREV
ncbi:MAG: ribosome recycling factor [Bifidobacteriaceae bacterium]|jgi:ribosome recycling factor|nr:ribosome recycling factor [Bifidobacteriaceae bacterium]